MATLSKYLKRKKIRQKAFAEKVGISAPYLNQILAGKRRPGIDLMEKIQNATGGEVPVSEWLGKRKSKGSHSGSPAHI
ncbi:helix-turn-helix transcriptional regulator [Leisingera sp. M523]|uniref:helix-turn-helix domain-containing protein n=1 Tax=Leisingera sp. M523 TaxID=2867013 RepID=UPI0021A298B0|nr:helix-turn-helix transcriptional regulator [Leisingera sp. M523]UWQ30225.1 helix-turn-helix transcriptional regulator [Leisingera sp. M523]